MHRRTSPRNFCNTPNRFKIPVNKNIERSRKTYIYNLKRAIHDESIHFIDCFLSLSKKPVDEIIFTTRTVQHELGDAFKQGLKMKFLKKIKMCNSLKKEHSPDFGFQLHEARSMGPLHPLIHLLGLPERRLGF